MPIREYDCPKCGRFETIDFSIKNIKHTIKCEKCGSNCELLLSTCNAQFIGDGFFCNDYKSRNKPKEKSEKSEVKDNKKTSE